MSYTGTTFKALIAAHLNRDDLSNQIATFCELAVKKLERERFWFQMTSTTVATTAAQTYLSLPSGFIQEIIDGFRDTSGRSLKKETWAQVDYWQRRSAGTGEPDYYAIADKFYFYPIPNATYSLVLQYYKSLGFPTTLTNAWTDDAWDLTFWATMEEAWNYLGNQEELVKAIMQKNLRLAELRSLSGKHVSKGQVRYRNF